MAVAVEKMDVLLSGEKTWSSVTGVDDTEIDDVRLTECGEGFLQMLMAITDRYKILPQPGHKYSFAYFRSPRAILHIISSKFHEGSYKNIEKSWNIL